MINEEKKSIIERIIKSSLFLVDYNKPNERTDGYRSGFVGKLIDKYYLLSVVHKLNDGNNVCVWNFEKFYDFESKLLPALNPITIKVHYSTLDEARNISAEAFIKSLENAEEVDFYHSEINFQDDLIQNELFIDDHKIEKSKKNIIDLNELSDISKDKIYGFYGYRNHTNNGMVISSEGFLVYPINYNSENNDFIYFETNHKNAQKGDYEGLSGAPILDEDGKLIAIFTGYIPNYHLVLGFKAKKAVEFIKTLSQI